jgi:trk system potassium uptake protein
LGIYTQVIASDILSLKSFKETKQTLFFIVKLTAITEILSSLIMLPTMLQTYPLKKAIFMSFFHAVSSFCNAGFSLFPNKMLDYQHNHTIIGITTLLMIIGGLGFVTWHELSKKFFGTGQRFVSWHTKLVLRIYLLTALGSSIIFWLLEHNHTLLNMPRIEQLYVSLFMGISMKSTGFVLISFAAVHMATLMLAMICMFIGSAPLSTGSGIKTSVFAIYLAIIRAAIQGKRHAMIMQRHILDDQVYKAMAIIALSLSWIICIVFCLLIVQPDWKFIDILFTTFAAFSNNGITLKDPAELNVYAKILLIISMIIGRIGALAIILSIKRISELRDLSYPKEHVILG